ncbi:MAG: hypothetical protein JO319_12870 [Acidobacteriaceae bacterium]|nr:hypothetical protein [Acidobacteriaceae bacterium]
MLTVRIKLAASLLFTLTAVSLARGRWSQESAIGFLPEIPKTWDDAAIATLEVPLADPVGSPKHVPADYYYEIPVRPIYKEYPVYALGREPPGYMEWLKQQEPVVLWDAKGHAPPLKTRADWIKAGEMVFDAPIAYGGLFAGFPGEVLYVRQPEFYSKTGTPVAADGTVPFYGYVVRTRGEIQVGILACAMCHTRIMPAGAVLKGAQGNFPFDRVFAYNYRYGGGPVQVARFLERLLYAAPWVVSSEASPNIGQESLSDIASVHETIPPGVIARHRTSPFFPAQVPDLIDVKDRRYLDRTGLQQQRSIVDLMRYAALNQGGDDLASYNGFVPADFGNFKTRPDPNHTGGRYSDEQLYALALYIYSLKPPPNPNKFDAVAARGQKVFEREGCARCHTPPLYTNNKLTLAEGFTPPPGADKNYNILFISVGTDPNLALKTRRGTGYYKVPSLKGVWYRGMFGHSGWCATLEDWFDPGRLQDDYVPTGFKPYRVNTYAVKGHPFGLNLSAGDKQALIAFLKTL